MLLNFLAHMTAQAFNKIYPLIVYSYAQARLGTTSFGQALFAVSLVDCTSPLIEAGTSNYGQIRVGADQADRPAVARLLGRVHALRLANAVGAFLLLQGAVALFYRDYAGIVAAISFMLVTSAIDMTYVQTGSQRVWAFSALTVSAKVAVLGLIYALVRGPESATLFAVLIVLSNSLISLGTAWLAVRKFGLRLPTWPEVRELYRVTFPFLLIVLMLYGLEKFDYLIVEALHDARAVGLYGGASRIFLALGSLVPALALAFGSEMLSVRDKVEFSRQTRLALGAVSLLVLPAAVGAWFVARPLLVLIYDEGFADVATPFAVLCASLVPQMALTVYGTYVLLTRGHTTFVCGWLLAGLALGSAVAVAASPTLGLTGVALGVVASKALPAAAFWLKARAEVDRGTGRLAGRNLAAAAVMGAALLLVGPRDLVVTLALGAVAFGGAAAVLNRDLLAELAKRVRRPVPLGGGT